jgi:hypothetical protein
MGIKKLLKKIRKGDRDSLLALIDYALDEYHEDAFNLGYNAFKADSSVHAMRIAMAIHAHAKMVGEPSKDQIDVNILDVDETAEVIKQYLENEI